MVSLEAPELGLPPKCSIWPAELVGRVSRAALNPAASASPPTTDRPGTARPLTDARLTRRAAAPAPR